jgi:ABC-type transport system involved in cytochrome bd biosynthesis fused ATPase/permease subunit
MSYLSTGSNTQVSQSNFTQPQQRALPPGSLQAQPPRYTNPVRTNNLMYGKTGKEQVYIAVMGVTGSGKSTFIEKCGGGAYSVPIGAGMRSSM